MNLPLLPKSFPAGYISGTEHFYTLDQIKAYGKACREAALLEAMNATLAFGKTGAVIAAAIGALKS
jgi:hypothetical protein